MAQRPLFIGNPAGYGRALGFAVSHQLAAPARAPADRYGGRRHAVAWQRISRSVDNLKVLIRCGCKPCAAQIRCTLRWLIPAALAIARQPPPRPAEATRVPKGRRKLVRRAG